MGARSQAYDEGYYSGPEYCNPYPTNSQEYNEFERGWTQRLKRMPSSWANGAVVGRKVTLAERYRNMGKLGKADKEPAINHYAKAKHR